jgi:hypothetical protein
MSGKENCWGTESFFKRLKGEVDNLEGRHRKKQVRAEVFE